MGFGPKEDSEREGIQGVIHLPRKEEAKTGGVAWGGQGQAGAVRVSHLICRLESLQEKGRLLVLRRSDYGRGELEEGTWSFKSKMW